MHNIAPGTPSNQQLPEERSHGIGDEDELTSKEINMIYEAEQLALEQDETASNSKVDNFEPEDLISKSSNEDEEGDSDFILKVKQKGPKVFKGKKSTPNVTRDANYTFCPLAHRVSILHLLCKHFCQHLLLRE